MTAALLVSVVHVARAEPVTGSGPGSGPESDTIREGSEEVEEVVRALAEAGVPPTREDLARFLETAEKADETRVGPGSPFSVNGSARVRLGHFPGEGMDRYGKLGLATRWVRVRARFREYRAGIREATGTLAAGGGQVELRLGEVGLSQGFGLLIGLPGRSSSLAADAGFSARSERFVSWLGSPDPAAFFGFGARVRSGAWCLRIMKGSPRRFSGNPGPSTSVVQLCGNRGGLKLSAAGLEGAQGRGTSLAGSFRLETMSGSFETMVWQATPGNPPTGAAVFQMGWTPVRGSGLEGLFGFADLDAASGPASRPAVLSGWDGRGFALRGFTRTARGIFLRAMFNLGRHLDRTGSRSRMKKVLVDLQAGKKLSPQIELSVRLRSTGRREWVWSPRYPWQPPRAAGRTTRSVMSGQVVLDLARWRGRLLVRSYGLDQMEGDGRRSLVSLSGVRLLGRGWKMRGTWVTAWGDPVDLVSAVSPLTGMVLPRHWGRWRSETVLGLEWGHGGARIVAAGSVRHPEPESGENMRRTIWAEAGIHW